MKILEKIFGNLNPQALIKGLLMLFALSGLFYLAEYAFFMLEVSKLGKGFVRGGQEVVESNKMFFIEFASIFFRYGISAMIVSIYAKNFALVNSFFLGVIGAIFFKLIAISSNPSDFAKYAWLNLAEVVWALIVCLMVGAIYQVVKGSKP